MFGLQPWLVLSVALTLVSIGWVIKASRGRPALRTLVLGLALTALVWSVVPPVAGFFGLLVAGVRVNWTGSPILFLAAMVGLAAILIADAISASKA